MALDREQLKWNNEENAVFPFLSVFQSQQSTWHQLSASDREVGIISYKISCCWGSSNSLEVLRAAQGSLGMHSMCHLKLGLVAFTPS